MTQILVNHPLFRLSLSDAVLWTKALHETGDQIDRIRQASKSSITTAPAGPEFSGTVRFVCAASSGRVG